MPVRMTETVRPPRLVALWFGIQLAWGAILGISLQARVFALVGHSDALSAYAWVSGSGALASAITQLVVGPWSDALRRRGDKRLGFYAIGAACGAVALVAFYLAPALPALLVAFVALQIAFNVAIGPYQAILPDFVENEHIGVASGWMAAMQSAGNAAGAVLATILGSTPVLGMTIAATFLVSAAITIFHARTAVLQPVATKGALLASGGRALADLFISRALVYLGFYTLLGYLYFYVTYALPAGAKLNATTASGLCILLFTIVGAAGAGLAARPADRLDERLVVALGGGIVAGCVLALAVIPGLLVIPVSIAIAGVGWGVFLCADWAFACRVLPRGALATSMAIWNIAVVGPQTVAPLLATVLLTRLGTLHTAQGPRDAFTLASAEIFVGALWIWRLPRRLRGN